MASEFIDWRGVYGSIRSIAKGIRARALAEGHDWMTIRNAVDCAVDGFGEHHNIWVQRRRK